MKPILFRKKTIVGLENSVYSIREEIKGNLRKKTIARPCAMVIGRAVFNKRFGVVKISCHDSG